MKTYTFLIVFMILSAMNLTAQMPPIEAGVSQKLAQWRGKHYSDVRYKLNITLEKGAPLMKGEIEVSVKLTDEGAKNDLILDWRTTQFENDKDKPFAEVIKVNESSVKETVPNGVFDYQINKEHLIISQKYLKTGENVIKIAFASPIKTSGSAITRYVDKEDNAEYVYSLFVPSDASTAFPVFDQPDLKAQFYLTLSVREDWKAISNTLIEKEEHFDVTDCTNCIDRRIMTFQETKPISTYVFAFAAGEFAEFEDKNNLTSESSKAGAEQPFPTCKSDKVEWKSVTFSEDKAEKDKLNTFAGQEGLLCARSSASTSKIYVRKSQAEKFKQHSAEVFRLNREGVKYLESYFDYKFPFPKYDLVLLPEFPFGGMEHAGATFLRESSVIFPNEPTKNDFVSRANLIFHEAAHQWFGDTVTMKWFDDLWLKEGFAEFMAYKTLAQVMPEYNAWKIFYERNKQFAYLTDSTKGTTPIYQEITNLSSAKSAYGNIVYRKAPSFLKQAEFYLGEKEFQTAVRAFLKKHEFANAEWTDLVKEFETASKKDLKDWANTWVKQRGLLKINYPTDIGNCIDVRYLSQFNLLGDNVFWNFKAKALILYEDRKTKEKKQRIIEYELGKEQVRILDANACYSEFGAGGNSQLNAIFPNYQDYGYGIFPIDYQSRDYIIANIQSEKDDFLRTMMWGALWDSVREGELAPKTYIELVIKNINVETDESTINTLLNRVGVAMNYYLSEPSAVAGGLTQTSQTSDKSTVVTAQVQPSATADGSDIARKLETLLIEKMQNSETIGQRITFYRAFLNIASSEMARTVLKEILNLKFQISNFKLKTKDKFDIVTKLIILGDKDAVNLLTELEKTEISDEAKRYAYAARAGIGTAENKLKFWNDFVSNKDISESWIESAFVSFNSPKHSDLTLIYLEKALAELPNLKRNRKIFFVNGWLASFIGGQRSEEALKIINKFLADNPNLDKDLRLKILENVDLIERAVKIRAKFGK